MDETNPTEQNFTTLDLQVLNIIQAGFPVDRSPYGKMAVMIGGNTTEQQVFECVRGLIDRKIIRRLGAIFDTKRLGFMSTLMAMRVPADRIDEVGEMISAYPGVSHNYKREFEYNLWFTLAAPSRQGLLQTIQEIKLRTGIEDVLYLPTVRMHKIFVNFDMTEKATSTAAREEGAQ
jgi:DNA-binding Lrp family transcriptional regulator